MNKIKRKVTLRLPDPNCKYCVTPGSGIMTTGSELDYCFCRRDYIENPSK